MGFRQLSSFRNGLLAAGLVLLAGSAVTARRLQVSENGRFLVYEDGQAFFYLGDTAWELFHRLDRAEAARYLDDRAAKGFTVIQAVALAELDGLHTPNPYGHLPLVDDDPTRPAVREGPDNDYWDHVDFIIREANRRGLFIGLLPTWGDKWNRKWGVGPEIFTPENAAAYGEWLGRRYRDTDLIWILGGDRPIETERHREIIRAFARGLRRGDGGSHLITFHPMGGQSSAQYFHEEEWLDFNLRQNGHETLYDRYDGTLQDYRRTPVKPVIDGEPVYEDHPISFRPKEFGHSIAADVRRALYWDLFNGAAGHTYGHHSVWQMWRPGRDPINFPLLPWFEAIDQPGAAQMQHARRLLLSRPYLTRIPDDSVLAEHPVPTVLPGSGHYRFKGARDAAGSYAMVYAPVGRPFRVRLGVIHAAEVRAWWFDPRTGEATLIGAFPASGEKEFRPPQPGEVQDWILVLDAADRNFPPPGAEEP
ncbi:MAG: glycoside hydrolase family 140 protein [Acidobacteriota bacterium]